ncbi:MAG: Uma2 family endonuclease [Myxococcota bacterium]
MGVEPRRRVAEAEYLALEASADVRHEWVDGEMLARAGGSDRHNVIAVNLVGELRNRLRGGPCQPFGSDQRHHVTATGLYTYPDALVRCRDLERPDAAARTRVVFEVLSASTEAWDRGQKFAHYRADPDIEEYVLVSQRARRVEHFRRVDVGRWTLTLYGPGDDVALPALGIALPVDEIYLGAAAERSDAPDPDDDPLP